MSKQQVIIDFISAHPAFSSLDPSGRSYVLANATLKKIKKGDVLFKAKGESENFYYIVDGAVSLENPNGKYKQNAGTFLGVDVVFSGLPYHNTVTALKDTTLVVLPSSFLNGFVKEHPEILPHLLSTEETTLTKKLFPEKHAILWREAVGYIATFIVPVIAYNLMGGTWVDPAITLFMCILSATVTMWFFRLFPSYIPALFFLLAILSLGLAPPEVMLHGFATKTFIILMSTFTLGAAILISGLGHRIMLMFFNVFSGSFFQSNLALFFSGVFLTPFMPSIIARGEIAAPMFLEATQALKFKRGSMATTQLSITLFFGITLFSSVFLSGSLLNYMVLALLPEYMQVHFSWSMWIKSASIYGGVVLIGYLVASLYYLKDSKSVKISNPMIKSQLKIIGPMTANERLVVLAVLLFMFGILTVSLHKIETAWIAFFVMFFLLFFQVLRTQQFRQNIDWTFLIVIATTIGISYVLKHIHVDEFLFDGFVKLMNNYKMTGVEFLLFSAVLTFVVRVILPLGPAAVVAGTLTIPLAEHYHTHPWVIAFAVLVMIDVWFFSHQSPTYNLFKKQAHLNNKLVYNEKHFMTFNATMNFVKVVGLLASIPLWQMMGML